MAPPTLVVLSRSFDDPETPTAATFSLNNRNASQHNFSNNDYDEGDILDELLQETPTPAPTPAAVTPLSQEALRSVPAPTVVSVPDDGASTCSSTTIGESYTDADANDDSSSITSVSVSGSSVVSSPSSCTEEATADSQSKQTICTSVGAAAAAAAGASTGRRRRRRNRSGLPAVAATPTSCASDAGSESPSVTARPRKNSARQRPSTLKAVDSMKEEAVSPLPPTNLQPPSETDQPNQPKKSNRSKGKNKGHKSALITEARRSRHPKLQIGLDLDVELQLKSKVRGDICLTLVLEETQNVIPRASPEIRRNAAGQFVAYDEWEDIEGPREILAQKSPVTKMRNADSISDADGVEEVEVTRVRRQRPGALGTQRRELCHLRVGRLNLTRRWWMDGYEMISHIPPPVVAGVAVTMPVAGFAVGWAAANWGGYWPW